MPALLAIFCVLAFPQWPVFATVGFVLAGWMYTWWGDGASQMAEIILFYVVVIGFPVSMLL